MPYLNTTTGEYPRFDGDLELLGWQVGQPLPSDWVEVTIDPTPSLIEGETYEIRPPQLIDGVWRQTWTVRAITEAERHAYAVERVRQKVLQGERLTAEEAGLLTV